MTHHGKTRALADTPLVWGDDRSHAESSPPTTPVWLQSIPARTAKVLEQSPLYGTDSTSSPSPTVSMLSRASDQPLSARRLPLTPTRELGRSNHNPSVTARGPLQLSTRARMEPELRPAGEGYGSRTSDLHPDLAAIRWSDSRLKRTGDRFSNGFIIRCLLFSEFEAVKLRIQEDPDYVGDMSYVRLLNPQYEVANFAICAAPMHSLSKWYVVIRGTTVGIFNDW